MIDVTQLIKASDQADIKSVFGDEMVVASLAVGKKSCVFTLTGGRVAAASTGDEPSVTIPVTNKQLDSMIDGSLQLSEAYMQGDIKPVGSSRALLHVIELLDHKDVQKHLALLSAD